MKSFLNLQQSMPSKLQVMLQAIELQLACFGMKQVQMYMEYNHGFFV